MSQPKRGRPRKDEADKLRPVTINLRAADYDAAYAFAKAHREALAVVLRQMAVSWLRQTSVNGRERVAEKSA